MSAQPVMVTGRFPATGKAIKTAITSVSVRDAQIRPITAVIQKRRSRSFGATQREIGSLTWLFGSFFTELEEVAIPVPEMPSRSLSVGWMTTFSFSLIPLRREGCFAVYHFLSRPKRIHFSNSTAANAITATATIRDHESASMREEWNSTFITGAYVKKS